MRTIYTRVTAILFFVFLHAVSSAQYNWDNVGSGMNSPVRALASDTTNDILYAGGVFTQAGGIPAINIAKWDGVIWSPIGGGVISGSAVSALLVNGTELIAGGTFTNIGGVLSNNIAKWDGLTWSPIGAGLDYTGVTTVSTLAMYNGELYAGGIFNSSGAATGINNIAKWDGTNWIPLTTGTNGPVRSLCVYGTDLYVGGTFTDAGGVPVNNIAKWDGTTWSDVGGGTAYTGVTTVATMTVYGGNLIAGGTFTTAGATAVKHIAQWNGVTWSDVGGGASSYTGVTTVATLTVFNGEVIVGGSLDTLGVIPTSYIGKWDGSAWTQMGSGTNNTVLALSVMHDTLYAGGLFPVAGGDPNPFVAEWVPSPPAHISGTASGYESGNFLLFPNPIEDRVFVKNIKSIHGKNISLTLYDVAGRAIYVSELRNENVFDRGSIAPGLYIYKITDEDRLLQQGKLSFR